MAQKGFETFSIHINFFSFHVHRPFCWWMASPFLHHKTLIKNETDYEKDLSDAGRIYGIVCL